MSGSNMYSYTKMFSVMQLRIALIYTYPGRTSGWLVCLVASTVKLQHKIIHIHVLHAHEVHIAISHSLFLHQQLKHH